MKKRKLSATKYLLHANASWAQEELFASLHSEMVNTYRTSLSSDNDMPMDKKEKHNRSIRSKQAQTDPLLSEDVCSGAVVFHSPLNAEYKDSKQKNVFPCYCRKEFTSSRELIIHMRTHPEEKPFQCKFCPKRFTRSQSLTTHMHTHTNSNKKSFACDVCTKPFARKFNLVNHMKTHQISNIEEQDEKEMLKQEPGRLNHRPLATIGSAEKLSNSEDLERNTVLESGNNSPRTSIFEKPFKCQNCCKSFFTKYALTIHIQTHCNKQLRRHICNSTEAENHDSSDSTQGVLFSQLKNTPHLAPVMSVNMVEKPIEYTFYRHQSNQNKGLVTFIRPAEEGAFKCKLCDLYLHSHSNLVVHMRTHLEEKPFKCTQCEMEFRTNGSLIVHMRSHNPEKEFKCKFCTMQFHTKGSLVVHTRKYHPGLTF